MKRFFKITISILLIVALYATWGIVLTNKDETRSAALEIRSVVERKLGIDRPCSRPLEFSVGEVDPNFGVSQNDFLFLSIQAAKIWNDEAGKEMLKYNPQSEFKINLVFDERQENTLEAQKMEEGLQELESSYNEISGEYNSLNAVYQSKVDAYNKALKKYEKEIDNFNDEVASWNKKGGAPEDVYEDLENKKEELEKQLKKLEAMRREINNLVKESNKVASQENQIANSYNANLETYKSEFGGSREFEKGVFDGTGINIYQFKEKADLEMTLIHELGHYLGLDHAQNPASIMYYLIGDQDLKNPTLTEEDMAALGGICKVGG